MVKYSHLYLTWLTCAFGLVIAQDAPSVLGSYRAVGEMVYHTAGVLNQVYFEEDFDNKLGKSEFVVISALYNETFFEDTKTGQTWRIDEEGCVEYDASDWQNEHIPPDLKLYETQDGKPMFPIRQLLNMKKEHQVPSTTKEGDFRNVPTKIYEYKITDNDRYTKIKAYWSDGSMKSPSKYNIVPVAFELEVWKDDQKVRTQAINIHMFFQGAEDYHVYEPVRGVFCPGLKEDSLFRDKIKSMITFSFSSETVERDFDGISDLDAWMEPGNKLFRHDFTAQDDLWVTAPIKITRIVSLKQGSGTVYEIRTRYDGLYRCDVIGVDELKFEAETIVAHQNGHDIEEFFGLKSTKYYAVGATKERGLLCQLYHGLRNDWPPPYKNITTLWEWCIIKNTDEATVEFEEDHFPLVSLNIYVTKSPYNATTGIYYQGLKYTHHFYNLHSYSNNFLEKRVFDITQCFTEEQMAVLQFLIKTNDETSTALKDDIDNADFIAMWKNAIYSASGLKPESLRLPIVLLDFSSSSNMTVTFHILDRHDNISGSVEPITVTEAVTNIQNAVNNKKLGVTYTKSGRTFDLKVTSVAKRETYNPNKVIETPENGYSGGTMAAVAIIMLLIGGAIGAILFLLKKKYYDARR